MARMTLSPALRSAADDLDLDLDHAACHPEKYGMGSMPALRQ
jgi:hypothetical protein